MKIFKITVFVLLILAFSTYAQGPPPPPPVGADVDIPVIDNIGFLIIAGSIYVTRRFLKKPK